MPATLHIATSWGPICVSAASGEIIQCDLPNRDEAPSNRIRVSSGKIRAKAAADRRVLREAEKFIRALFRGKKPALPAVRVPDAPAFTQRAWRAMMKVGVGETISYRELAKRAGSPAAFRAAGQACAKNPIPLFIPCHRILAGNKRIGGFSCGLAWKHKLLELERSAA